MIPDAFDRQERMRALVASVRRSHGRTGPLRTMWAWLIRQIVADDPNPTLSRLDVWDGRV